MMSNIFHSLKLEQFKTVCDLDMVYFESATTHVLHLQFIIALPPKITLIQAHGRPKVFAN